MISLAVSQCFQMFMSRTVKYMVGRFQPTKSENVDGTESLNIG